MIAEKDGNSRRVQVKSASINKGGSYRCTLKHCRHNPKKYSKSDCDFLILYASYARDFEDIIHDGYYIIPVEALTEKNSFAILFPAGKGRGNILVCSWERYKDGWERL